MLNSLFKKRIIPIFVSTKVLVMETVEADFYPEDVGDVLIPGEVQEVVESWTKSLINVEDITGVTRDPDDRGRSIIWVDTGNIIVKEKFDVVREWMIRKKGVKKPIILNTEIKVRGEESKEGIQWSPTTLDLSDSYMINNYSDEDIAVVWTKDDKILIEDSLDYIEEVLNIKSK